MNSKLNKYLKAIIFLFLITVIFVAMVTNHINYFRLVPYNKSNLIFDYSYNQKDREVVVSPDWDGVMKSRLNAIKRVCKTYPELKAFEPDPTSFSWQDQALLSYCRNAKTGTTSWLALLFNLSAELLTSGRYFRDPKNFEMPNDGNFTKENALFLASVRHPFIRLLSGYRSKILLGHQKDFRHEILSKYRNNSKSFHLERWRRVSSIIGINIDETPTFYEFTSYIVDFIEKCWTSKNPEICLVNLDNHWKPFYVRCNPCVIKFDIIIKTETFENDYNYMKLKTLENLSKKLPKNKSNFYSKRNTSIKIDGDLKLKDIENAFTPFHKNRSKGPSTDELTFEFFNLLPKRLKERIVNAYLYDFELFDYDPYKFRLK